MSNHRPHVHITSAQRKFWSETPIPGAVMGGFIGGLLGPIGAVVGGIIGGAVAAADYQERCQQRAESRDDAEKKIAYGLQKLKESLQEEARHEEYLQEEVRGFIFSLSQQKKSTFLILQT